MTASDGRLSRIRGEIARREDIDLLIVSAAPNIRYLSGFTGTNGTLVIGEETACLLTDFRYLEQAAEQAPDFEIVDGGSKPRKRLVELFGSARAIGFDDENMRVKQHAALISEIPDTVLLVAASGIVESLRQIKDEQEIETLAQAASIADSIYQELAGQGLAGRTERDVAWQIELLAHERGASGLSFPPIVASGKHGALPHAEPRDEVIGRGELVVLDFGVVYGGYCSDCTRTFATGSLPEHQTEAYELVLEAQILGLEAAVPGALCEEVDQVARKRIADGGRGDQFGHSLGHGVGLEVHEQPTLSARSESMLEAGNVVTIEPGVYVEGDFGVRIEDLIVVSDGAPRVLTPFSKQLLTVD